MLNANTLSQGIFLEKRVFQMSGGATPGQCYREVFCLCPPFRRTENPDRLVTSKGPGQLSWRSPTNCWDRWDDDDDDDDEEEEEDDDGRCKNSPFGRQTTPLSGKHVSLNHDCWEGGYHERTELPNQATTMNNKTSQMLKHAKEMQKKQRV